ncbi:two-component regulator propeller domain-containing protein [Candidatus Poribacteria bacterium]
MYRLFTATEMKRIVPGLIFIPLLLLLTYPADSQTWRDFSTSDGLAGNTVTCITEASDGSMWIGTDKGLSQYNGLFRTYFAGKSIRCLLESGDGTIWAGTGNGLHSYNPSTGQEGEYLSGKSIACFLESGDGVIWAGTGNGLHSYNPATGQESEYLSGKSIICLLESGDGIIWAGTGNGLYSYNDSIWKRDIGVVYYRDVEDPIYPKVLSLLESKNGTIWAGVSHGPINSSFPIVDNWSLYSHDDNGWRMHLKDTLAPVTLPFEGYYSMTQFVIESQDGIIWASQHIEYIEASRHRPVRSDCLYYSYDGSSWSKSDYTWSESSYHEPGKADRISSVIGSYDGAVWIGTEYGLIRHDPNAKRNVRYLRGIGISCIFESQSGTIWVGTRGYGLHSYGSDDFFLWQVEPNDKVNCFLESQDDNGKVTICAGTSDGLYKYDGNIWKRDMNLNDQPYPAAEYPTLADPNVTCLVSQLEDQKRYIWAGTDYLFVAGLYSSKNNWDDPYLLGKVTCLLGSNSNVWAGVRKQWDLDYEHHGLYSSGNDWGDPYLSGEITCLLESNGTIWAGTTSGLYSSANNWADPPYLSGEITCLLESNGTIWAGTTSGLYSSNNWGAPYLNGNITSLLESQYDSEDGKIKEGTIWAIVSNNLYRYDDSKSWDPIEALANIPMHSLFESSDGKIWTYGGDLHVWNGEIGQQYLLDRNVNCCIESSDGSGGLWLGLDDGIILYRRDYSNPVLGITKAKSQTQDEQSYAIDESLKSYDTGDSSIFVEWTAGDIGTQTHLLHYQFDIDGKGWSNLIQTNFAKTPEMDVGEHAFSVRAIDREANHSEPDTLIINVDTMPPSVIIAEPADGAIVGGIVKITGSVQDSDPCTFEVECAAGTDPSDETYKPIGSGPAVKFGKLAELDTRLLTEGLYTIRVTATDSLGHTRDDKTTMTVDNTIPVAEISEPTSGQRLKGTIVIKIGIRDDHPAGYKVEIIQNEVVKWWKDGEISENSASVSSASVSSASVSSTSVSSASENNFIGVDVDTSAIYGNAIIRVTVVDKAGNKSAPFDLEIFLANEGARPTAHISSPREGDILAGTLDIMGEVSSVGAFKEYSIRVARGHNPDEDSWTNIAQSTEVPDGKLATWDTEDIRDGECSVTLVVTDVNGYFSEATVKVTVDNTAPEISLIKPADQSINGGGVSIEGTVDDDNFSECRIDFAEGAEPESGWEQIADVSESTEIQTVWRTQGLDGTYSIRITATDRATPDSNQAEVVRVITLDNTLPRGIISYPQGGQVVRGVVQIMGTADDTNLTVYHIQIGQGQEPIEWETLIEGSTLKVDDILLNWDTLSHEDGEYSIKLTVEDPINDPAQVITHVVIDNTPPTAEITDPEENEFVKGDLRIIGTAQDQTFSSCLVEYGPGPNPQNSYWKGIQGIAVKPVVNGLLRSWNTNADEVVDGVYSLRLTVEDKAGNISEARRIITVDNHPADAEITVPLEKAFVSGVIAITGTAEDANFTSYRIELGKGHVSTEWEPLIESSIPQQDGVLLNWDTSLHTDGEYSIRLTVADRINEPTQVIVHVTVDNTPPVSEITFPGNNDYVKDDLKIRGTAQDENFWSYLVEYASGMNPQYTDWQGIQGLAVEPVTGGVLRSWNTTLVGDGSYTLRLTVMDRAENASETQRIITVDNHQADAVIVAPVEGAFVSGIVAIDGIADDVNFVEYQIEVGQGREPAEWEELIKSLTARKDGVLHNWDTSSYADGEYSIKLIVKDGINNPSEKIRRVTVDNTFPTASITYPKDDQFVNGDLSIMGTAQDDNFARYLVEYAPGTNPLNSGWRDIAGYAIETVDNGELRLWNTQLVGDATYSLRLTVQDKAKHISVARRIITIDNSEPAAEINRPETNTFVKGEVVIAGIANDANFTGYRIELRQNQDSAEWETLIESGKRRQNDVLLNWDTSLYPDGEYFIKLIVEDVVNEPGQAIVRITVDNTLPIAEITSPVDNQYVNGDLEIIGTAQDENFSGYVVEYAEGVNPLDASWQVIAGLAPDPVTDDVLRSWNTMPVNDGSYTLRLTVQDDAGNMASKQIAITVDNNQAGAMLFWPEAGDFVSGVVAIEGTADDPNFTGYQVEVGQGQFPAEWDMLIESETGRRNDVLVNWDTSLYLDGEYSIKLTVEDEVNEPAKKVRRVIVDNTLPTASISYPEVNQYVNGDLEVEGTAQDDNFFSYLVEYAPGANPPEVVWQPIAGIAVEQVTDGVLRLWNTKLAIDGVYSLRLTVEDRAGHRSMARRLITIDNREAAAEIKHPVPDKFVTGEVAIEGIANDTNFTGYRIELLQGQETIETLIESERHRQNDVLFDWDTSSYTDGKYSIKLTVADEVNDPAEDTVHITVDNTMPDAGIISPADNQHVNGELRIMGTAQDENFESYLIQRAKGLRPSDKDWISIPGANKPVTDGVLRSWNTTTVDDGVYSMRLKVMDKAKHESIAQWTITIDNRGPSAVIAHPEEDAFVTGEVAIRGIANDANFVEYRIELLQGQETLETLIESPTPQQAGILFSWDTPSYPDGEYSIKLIVEDEVNEPAERRLHVTLDNTSPIARILYPEDNQYVNGDLEIMGNAQDENFESYIVKYAPNANPSDLEWQDIQGIAVEPVKDGVLRSWNTNTVDDGIYSLRLTVQDKAGRTSTARRIITIDNSRPAAKIDPRPDAFVKGGVVIEGTANDTNFTLYRIELLQGQETVDTLIQSETRRQNGVLLNWDTSSYPDGKYSIKLTVEDEVGGTNQDTVPVTVDNTIPIAGITSPVANQYVNGNVEITGTAQDDNFESYIVKYAQGVNPQDTDWQVIAGSAVDPVTDGILRNWNTNEVGDDLYSLRLTVQDRSGNTREVQRILTVDNRLANSSITTPVEGFVKGEVLVTGTADDPNFVEYSIELLRGQEAVETLIESPTPQQAGVLFSWDTLSYPDGEYSIKLTVKDEVNDPAEDTVGITVDNTMPDAEITSPPDNDYINGDVEIKGTAWDYNFSSYLVEYAPGANPSEWRDIEGAAGDPVADGVLRNWSTTTVDDGFYSIRLTVTDEVDNARTARWGVTVDNNAPAAILDIRMTDGIVAGREIEITGTADDDNFRDYQVSWRAADKKDSEAITYTGTEPVNDGVLALWDVVEPDGDYMIELVVHDESEQQASDSASVILDNTDPTAEISSPQGDDQVGGVVEIRGTAIDTNFAEYIMEYGEGASPQVWTLASEKARVKTPVTGGKLFDWITGDKEGAFTLRLTVKDKVGHEEQASVVVNVIPQFRSQEGGECTSADGMATLYIPPRAMTTDKFITMNYVNSDEVQAPPDNGVMPIRTYDIGPEDIRFDSIKPATLQVLAPVDSAQNGRRLAIFRYDQDWKFLGGTVRDGKITMGITRTGRYALMEIETMSQISAEDFLFTCQPRVFSPKQGESATVVFSMDQETSVTLRIYNIDGRLMKSLISDETMSVGRQAVVWDGRDESNQEVPSGLYLIALSNGGSSMKKKTVLVLNR